MPRSKSSINYDDMSDPGKEWHNDSRGKILIIGSFSKTAEMTQFSEKGEKRNRRKQRRRRRE